MRTPLFISAIVALALSIVAYHAAPSCGLVWDDIYLTTKNPYVQSVSGLSTLVSKDWWTASALGEASAYYRPLVLLTFWLNRLIGGNTAASYHVGNVALHVGAVVLAMVWLRRLVPKSSPWLAGALGLWFGACALDTETVVWISGRCESVGVIFALAAFLANAKPTRGWSFAAYALAFASALSKEPFIVVLPLLVAQDVLLSDRDRRRCLISGLAAIALVIVYFTLRRVVGVVSGAAFASVGLIGLLASFTFLVLTMAPLVLIPTHLDTAHLYRPPSTTSIVLVLGAMAVVTVLLARAALRGGRAAKVAAFGWVVFGLTLAPVALANADQGFTGERYFYFPLLGLSMMAAGGLSLLKNTRAPAVVVGLAALAQVPFTMLRVRDWRDDETLFRASIDQDPSNGYAMYALADIEARKGKYDDAEQHLLGASAAGWHDHHTELTTCFVYMHQKRHSLAEPACIRATESNPRDPRAWLNLASEYANEGKHADAEGAATNAIDLKPSYAEAYFVRGLARSRENKVEAARDDLNKTLALNPAHAQAGTVLARLPAK